MFHLVKISVFPFIGGKFALLLMISNIAWWYSKDLSGFYLSGVFLFFLKWMWYCSINQEENFHTMEVSNGLRVGMLLFIMSEICFFFSFFWSWFHFIFLDSAILFYKQTIVDPFAVPLLNSLLLVSSGATLTLSHHNLTKNQKHKKSLFFTILLGLMFLSCQMFEYKEVLMNFKTFSLGSKFFILTGFHGLHVTIGALMLLIVYSRKTYSSNHHIGFECAAWYWHFVDVVWLFLYIFMYVY